MSKRMKKLELEPKQEIVDDFEEYTVRIPKAKRELEPQPELQQKKYIVGTRANKQKEEQQPQPQLQPKPKAEPKTNAWQLWCQAWAQDNAITYGAALNTEACRTSYQEWKSGSSTQTKRTKK